MGYGGFAEADLVSARVACADYGRFVDLSEAVCYRTVSRPGHSVSLLDAVQQIPEARTAALVKGRFYSASSASDGRRGFCERVRVRVQVPLEQYMSCISCCVPMQAHSFVCQKSLINNITIESCGIMKIFS